MYKALCEYTGCHKVCVAWSSDSASPLPVLKQERGLVCQVGVWYRDSFVFETGLVGPRCQLCSSIGNSHEPCGIWNEMRWALRGCWMLVYVEARGAEGVTPLHTITTPHFLNRNGCYVPVGFGAIWRAETSNPTVPVVCSRVIICSVTPEDTSVHWGPPFPMPPTEQ